MINPIPFNIDYLIERKYKDLDELEKEERVTNQIREELGLVPECDEYYSDIHLLKRIQLQQELAAFKALKNIMATINSIEPYGEPKEVEAER